MTSRCFKFAAAVLALGAIGAGCAGKLHAPGPADEAMAQTQWPGTTMADLAHGRRLYIDRCSSCHSLYQPQEYEPQRWRGFVEEMVDRAKLTPSDATSVIRYLMAAAQVTRPGTTAIPGTAVSSVLPATTR